MQATSTHQVSWGSKPMLDLGPGYLCPAHVPTEIHEAVELVKMSVTIPRLCATVTDWPLREAPGELGNLGIPAR